MSAFRMKPLIIALPMVFGCSIALQVQASDTTAAVKSLDSIASQSSEIPSLLLEKNVTLPEPVVSAQESRATSVPKSARYRLQTSQAQADALNAQIATMKAAQEKKIAELTRQILQAQESASKSGEAQQQLKEMQKQLADMQTKWQNATQQLENANKRIAELSAGRLDDGQEVEQLKQSLTDTQSQNVELTKKITALSALQDAKAVELATAKKALADSDVKRADAEKKWQSASQQLEMANKRVVEMNASHLEDSQQVINLKQSLTETQKQAVELTKKMTALNEQQNAKTTELAAANKALTENEAKRAALEKKWQEANSKLESQSKQLASLHTEPETPVPNSKDDIRAYALGAFWGHDVLSAMKKVESDGFTLSQPQIISGVMDMMRGKFKISQEQMLAELKDMDTSVMAKSSQPSTSEDEGKKFIAAYSKKPGVKRADMGYYYRITEKGRGEIKNSDIVAIAVTESLSNGKVIKDMNKLGKVLVLPLEKFPPLFKTAISKLNNKGTLQMVVPPELAYGNAGSPPNIPPNSTMIYDVKIVNVTH
ncbi:FKBP-type peptidyl-prolyl cis-trans isomerase [Enterobacter asburiae]|uniref:FKBP-type peptidyl-prolyl cis-trans isomerase N-terminal domain-containing protein n=1 Tax=Enterobacter asburiae TaxID=61645 RepID=UPI00187E9817|nr:FKBP-type peptidyl-prolyl cis-trans isomerase [Enterobacter asburiae]QOV77994.1 FKBP-type peptidyl-prolyl cis-trans isomerase [Enterobacter asburiae]